MTITEHVLESLGSDPWGVEKEIKSQNRQIIMTYPRWITTIMAGMIGDVGPPGGRRMAINHSQLLVYHRGIPRVSLSA